MLKPDFINASYSPSGELPGYPWPASALTPEDMAALYAVREGGPERMPITELIAQAVRRAYAQAPVIPFPQPTELKEAA